MNQLLVHSALQGTEEHHRQSLLIISLCNYSL
ncbi:hypothetical protein [Salmonella phage NINP13076]|nr:hypothetical protein [Salmonella phage NINP13076]